LISGGFALIIKWRGHLHFFVPDKLVQGVSFKPTFKPSVKRIHIVEQRVRPGLPPNQSEPLRSN